MLAEAALYVDNADFRRAVLVDSLANPTNIYSRQRLDAYGLKTKGWDLLPEWNPVSVAATVATAEDLRAHRPLGIAPGTTPLCGTVPGREAAGAGPGAAESGPEGASTKPTAANAGRAGGAENAVRAARGQALFVENCESCHSNEAFGGPPVPADRVGTDRALAFGTARGTGKYRPPALVDVAEAAPYFHHGAVQTLEDVLSPARLEATYAKSPLGKGAVMGHRFGMELPAADRAALVTYLRTL